MSNYIVINPESTASKLAHQKVVTDLVDSAGHSAVLKETDLYKSDGTYKTWVQGIYMDEYNHYLDILSKAHDEKLMK